VVALRVRCSCNDKGKEEGAAEPGKVAARMKTFAASARAALYRYLFSKDNPHVEPLEKSFRALEANFRSQNCMLCHEPDNRSRINDLLLLNYPNQALIMRRALVAILESNQMPPGSDLAHQPQGVQDVKVLREMTRLAKDFEKQADEAFAWEASHKATGTRGSDAPEK
jgi:hypothetical protein